MTRGARDGFAMPMAILLMLVVGATAAMMLSRADAQSRAVRRQVDGYQVYHGGAGIQQTLKAWLDQQRNRGLRDLLDPDGLALTIDPRDGTALRVYAFDAQGLVRGELSGVPAESRVYLEQALATLRREVGDLRLPLYTREVGPWPLSVNAAPDVTTRAIAQAVAGEGKGEQLARAIAGMRGGEEPIDREALGQAMTDAGLTAEERAQFNAMVTVEPTLWELVIDLRGAGANAGAGLMQRYRALTTVAPQSAGTATYERPPPFLTWEKEEVQQYSVQAPLPRTPER